MSCSSCPYKTFIKCPFEVRAKSKIVIIGESPGENELIHNPPKPFIGESGKLLLGTMAKFTGLKRDNLTILNSIKCMGDNKNKKEFNLAMKCCRENVTEAINKVKPKLIVVFGGYAMKQILGNKDKITSKSGRFFWSEEFKCNVLVSIHPSYALRNGVSVNKLNNNSAASRLWINTFIQLKNYIKNKYKVIELDTSDYKELTDKDKDGILKAKVVAIDYETNSLKMFEKESKILSLSFTIKPGKSRVITDVKSEIDFIKKVLTDKTKIIPVAFRPFEELYTLQKLGFKIKANIIDVLTMAHVIHEANLQNYSLEEVAGAYAGMPKIKNVAEGQRANLENVDKPLLVRYNGVDTDATLRSYLKMKTIFDKEPKLKRYYLEVVQKAQNIYTEISTRPFKIDMMNVVKLENELKETAEDYHTKALDLLPESLKEKYKSKLKLSIPSLIIDYLFEDKDGLKFKPKELTKKTNRPTTAEKHLKQFRSKSKFVDYLLHWKKANKLITTYFKQIYDNVNKEDSSLYSKTLFTGTKTGRLVILEPNLQTIPQRGEFADYIKNIFAAPDGWYLFERDLGQSELRIMAWQSKCKNMLKALYNGIDLHKYTASIIFKIPIDKVTKQQRQSCKPINFGFIYGAMPKTFQAVAKNDYGVDFSLQESTEIRKAFFETYPEILQYHKKVLNFARKYGYSESPLGRRRHFYNINVNDFWLRAEAERQAINHPIQSFSSDLNLISQIILEKYLRKEGLTNEIYTQFLIHDAMFGLCKKERIEDAQMLTKKAMEKWSKWYIKRYFKIDVKYPITSEFLFGTSWGNLKAVED